MVTTKEEAIAYAWNHYGVQVGDGSYLVFLHREANDQFVRISHDELLQFIVGGEDKLGGEQYINNFVTVHHEEIPFFTAMLGNASPRAVRHAMMVVEMFINR